jgi:hypothetical protein
MRKHPKTRLHHPQSELISLEAIISRENKILEESL